jgi:FkbM family methyltransferase
MGGGHVIDPSTTLRASICVPAGSGLRVAEVNFTQGDRVSTRLMAVHKHNDWVSNMIAWHGWWEIRRPSEFLNGLAGIGRHARLPRPGGTFLDIGANVGYYTLMFADRGDRVISIEPMARNRLAIQATLCMNPDLQARVRIVAAALGTAADVADGVSCVMRPQVQRNLGNGVLECGRNHTCRSPEPPSADTLTQRTGMSLTLAQWRHLPCEEVPLRPLDAVLAELKPASVKTAKIDIEGHECLALAGGESIFTLYRPRLMVAEWKAAHVAACMRKLATRHGYIYGRVWGADKNVALWDDDRGTKRPKRVYESHVTRPTSAP